MQLLGQGIPEEKDLQLVTIKNLDIVNAYNIQKKYQ